MSDEYQASPAQITSIQAVAIRIVCEKPERAHPASTIELQNSSLRLTPATQSYPEIAVSERQGSKCIGTDLIGFPVSEASPAWLGEVRAPNQDEALSSIVARDGGGLHAALVTSVLLLALGLGWWAGLLDPYHSLTSEAPTRHEQIAFPGRAAAPTIDQQPTSGVPDNYQLSNPAGSDLGRNPGVDQAVARPAVPSNAQKTGTTKQTTVPHTPEKQTRDRLTPTSDTRPDTIEGWKIREVLGRSAVLQGPDGIRKVSIGDTVPGAGRIDSIVRWGSRWIVATSRGLITTD